ncbi:MAG: methylated-DNA--[protein]-cysteine S-methyltransferase [Coraliomargarita sp.]
MASINDNLFTTLVNYANPPEVGCRMLTSLGPICAKFNERGLNALYFDDDPDHKGWVDSVFREAFLKWLSAFQQMTPATQWSYLAPDGTDYQKSVWRQLLDLPIGDKMSYAQLAQTMGAPKSARAVGSAVAANPICLLIPCHRIVNASGTSGNYRWGADRKLALLDLERREGCDLLSLFQ